ncbi:PQQ-dependent sugar dehydrogenase [Phycisphaeraceae bacterium D3-23]
MHRSILTAVFALLLATPLAAQHGVATDVAFENLRFDRPLYLCHPGDGTDRVVVAEQSGRVFIFDNDPGAEQDDMHIMIDLRDITIAPGHRGQNEEGLLGVAFHPDFAENGQVFLHYSAARPKRNVLSRFTVMDDGETIDPESEDVILEQRQPFWNHNGGMIDFGPDGYLYIALGDGGAGGDTLKAGQDLSTLLAKILRIDVDQTDEARGTNYAIPEDNPFVDNEDARPEIWAYGLRNVWRFSFDREDGTLWAGDVGQGAWEEINIIRGGYNYGWRIREGRHDFDANDRKEDTGLLVDPLVEHPRSEAMSITGGYVYRGSAIPQIDGYYLYGDYERGNLWMIQFDGRRVRQQLELGQVDKPASFGEDRDGEVYICSFNGLIYKFVAGD